MIDSTEASKLFKKALPGAEVLKQVEYQKSFIFLAQPPDPNEFPVLFAVDQKTGRVRDFSPFDDVEDPAAFQKLFVE